MKLAVDGDAEHSSTLIFNDGRKGNYETSAGRREPRSTRNTRKDGTRKDTDAEVATKDVVAADVYSQLEAAERRWASGAKTMGRKEYGSVRRLILFPPGLRLSSAETRVTGVMQVRGRRCPRVVGVD